MGYAGAILHEITGHGSEWSDMMLFAAGNIQKTILGVNGILPQTQRLCVNRMIRQNY
jgi:hypothetical protein